MGLKHWKRNREANKLNKRICKEANLFYRKASSVKEVRIKTSHHERSLLMSDVKYSRYLSIKKDEFGYSYFLFCTPFGNVRLYSDKS